MSDIKTNRFLKYFPLLLDALRSVDPNPMRPAEAAASIRAKYEVPEQDLTRRIQGGTQSIFENDVHWARFFLGESGPRQQRETRVLELNPRRSGKKAFAIRDMGPLCSYSRCQPTGWVAA